MLKIEIIAVGRLRPGPLLSQWDEYAKRVQWPLTLTEIEGKNAADEKTKMLDRLKPGGFIFALDEHGKSLPSRDFARKIGQLATDGLSPVQFVIGGADGLAESVRKKASFTLSFGVQTWPHMLARVMLIEQIYRAQQILSGHPYHRD